MSEQLRKFAALVRKEAAEQERVKMEKVGQLLLAARALDILRTKVTHG